MILIFERELFDVWGIGLNGDFVSYHGKKYILVIFKMGWGICASNQQREEGHIILEEENIFHI